MDRDIDVEVVRAADDVSGRPVEVRGLMQSCLGPGPHELTLLSLERWTTSFTIRWFFASNEPGADIDLQLQDGLSWSVTDDLGNSYRGGDYGGGGGNSPHWRCTSYFAPQIASDAQSLNVRLESPVDNSVIDVSIHLG